MASRWPAFAFLTRAYRMGRGDGVVLWWAAAGGIGSAVEHSLVGHGDDVVCVGRQSEDPRTAGRIVIRTWFAGCRSPRWSTREYPRAAGSEVASVRDPPHLACP